MNGYRWLGSEPRHEGSIVHGRAAHDPLLRREVFKHPCRASPDLATRPVAVSAHAAAQGGVTRGGRAGAHDAAVRRNPGPATVSRLCGDDSASRKHATTAAAAERMRMQDSCKQYPQPPFPRQPQSAPGLASAMSPKPDRGEASYKGHDRFKGRKALVTGSDSGIGRAVAIACEGADVALSYLGAEQADAEEVTNLIEAEGPPA